jgi:hypothetical protein
MSLIDDPADRLHSIVRQIYGLLEMAMGQNWLAYRLQDESPVMSSTVIQMESFIRAAVDLLLCEGSTADSETDQDTEMHGFICGLLSP